MTTRKTPNVELHIEELILRGLPPGSREGLAEAIEEEIRRLITEGGVPPGLSGLPGPVHLPRASFEVDPRPRAGSIGSQVGRALHRGWTDPKNTK
jgi:hypothetical protein